MALPKQVQAQADALEQYERQVADARKANEPKPDDPPPDSPKDPQGSAPAPAPAPAPAESPKPADDDSNTWRQRYLSLQGQYNSQVPALQQQVQTLTESVSQLTQQLKVKEAPPPAPEADLVTKKDVDAFGEDLVDLARRIAKEEFGKRETKYVERIEALQGQLAEAKGQVGEVVESTAKSANERFFEALDARLPGWDKVQATAECQEWLGARIPGTTVTWDMALKDAAGRRDVKTVLEVFENFFGKHPTLDPNAKAPAPAPAKQELQRQVAPSKSSASTPTANTKRTYTGAEYQTESMRLMRLMQKGAADEAGRLEAELNAALAEGRVTP
jgi:hypothetical protein